MNFKSYESIILVDKPQAKCTFIHQLCCLVQRMAQELWLVLLRDTRQVWCQSFDFQDLELDKTQITVLHASSLWLQTQ